MLPAITLDPRQLKAKVTKKKFSLPSPGRSTDFGRETVPAFQPGDPTYQVRRTSVVLTVDYRLAF